MSTKQSEMWHGEMTVANLNVAEVIKELGVSKSYLYKVISKKTSLFLEVEQEDIFGMKIQLKL